MARSPRHANALAAEGSSTPVSSTSNNGHAAPAAASSSTPAVPVRVSTRHRTSTSISSSTTSSTPITPGPVTPFDSHPSTPAGPSRLNPHSKSFVEAKAHQLRSIGEKERTSCPFPEHYGGKVKCGVADEDAEDEVLMALAAACAVMDNRALSADELAAIAFGNGWARSPSAAIEPSTTIMNAIRAHHKRCERAVPPRQPLLAKHQLQGSVNESILQAALHPQAFESPVRPKGTVWFLASVGSKKWKSPFEGVDFGKLQVKKPIPIKKKPSTSSSAATPTVKSKSKRSDRLGSDAGDVSKGKGKPSMPKILLRLGPGPSKFDSDESDAESSRSGSRPRTSSASRTASVVPPDPTPQVVSHPTGSAPLPIRIKRPSSVRRVSNVLDSSSESDSSDSDVDMITELPSNRIKPKTIRKPAPPPLAISGFSGSPRTAHFNLHRNITGSPHSPYENFLPSPVLPNMPLFAQPHSSPFPSHSLDNTTWTVRHEPDQFAQLETSSSSSDDEMRDPRDPDWGMASAIIVRGEASDEGNGIVWTAAEDEANVKEATDALRVLFPMSAAEEEEETEPKIELNSLDNKPTPSETSSINGSVSTATPHPLLPVGCIKASRESASVALAAWSGQPSPAASPDLRPANLPLDLSPTQHLSKLSSSFEPDDMDVDEPAWLDESGEGPVKSPDESFEDHLSSAGDPTLEREKQNDLFAWAAEAAANRMAMQIKQEPEDYPSPLTTDPGIEADTDVGNALLYGINGYRASSASIDSHPPSRSRSASHSHSPSSGSSELPPFEIDSENASKLGLELEDESAIEREIICGPESISIDELDGWLPVGKDKTPRRKKVACMTRCSVTGEKHGYWGMGLGTIGVGNPLSFSLPSKSSPKIVRKRSVRNANRRRQSDPANIQVIRPDVIPVSLPENGTKLDQSRMPSPPASSADNADNADVEVKEESKVQPGAAQATEMEAIGTEELEKARVEAEAREERNRKAAKERAEQHKQLMEAYKQKLSESDHNRSSSFNFHLDNIPPRPSTSGSAWSDHPCPSPWSETPLPWGSGSTDSLAVHTPSGNGVLSPMLLQSVAGLSVDPQTPGYPPYMGMMSMGAGVVDPKALVSPTFPLLPMDMISGMGVGMHLDEAIHLNHPFVQPQHPFAQNHPQQQSQHQGSSSTPTATPRSAHTGAPGSSKAKSTASVRIVLPKLPVADKGKVSPVNSSAAVSTPATATPKEKVSIAPKEKEKEKDDAMVVDPTSTTTTGTGSSAAASDSKAPPTRENTTSPANSAGSGSASGATNNTSSSGNNIVANGCGSGNATGNGTTPTHAPAAAPGRGANKIVKPIIDGVNASVVDNIPVYVYVCDTKKGQILVLRRLDSDFINVSALLLALGIAPDKHVDYLHGPNALVHTHHTMPTRSPEGLPYSPGVSGVWVRLVEAQEMAKRVKPKAAEKELRNILRDDLFSRFANMAGIKGDHNATDAFGAAFATIVPGSEAKKAAALAKAPSSSTSPGPPPALAPGSKPANPANSSAAGSAPNSSAASASSLASSSANSKSAPNLTALATSAPATTRSRPAPFTNAMTPLAKNPLIRTAPATPPDGCPQPKRRRATIVGGMSPLVGASALPTASLAPGPTVSTTTEGTKKAGSQSPTGSSSLSGSSSSSPAKIAPSGANGGHGTPGGANGLGGMSGMRKVMPKVMPLTPAARRATRASVGGGEVIKPKMTR